MAHVDHYQIIGKLGAGSNAKVKLARDTRTDAQVALKVMKKNNGIFSRHLVQFQNEIQALNGLNHPHIVRVLDFSECAVYNSKSGKQFDVIYIVMELLPNGELFDVLFYTGRMEAPIARVYFKQLLNAVESCHAAGITHRDLKPDNILFDEHFNLKIADFGFAGPTKGRDGSGLLNTQLGTDFYAAPEIFLDEPYSGVSADLFSCGVILFILLNQKPAFGKAHRTNHLYNLFLTENDSFWDHHSSDKPRGFFSSDFKALINGLLAFDPARRPTLQQVLASRWLNGETLSVREAQLEISLRHTQVVRKKAKEDFRTVLVSARPGQYRGDLGDSTATDLSSSNYSLSSSIGQKTLFPFHRGTNRFTRLYTNFPAEQIMFILTTFMHEKAIEMRESDKKFKLRAKMRTDSDPLQLCVELFDAGDGSICVEVIKTAGDTHEFMTMFEKLKGEFEAKIIGIEHV